MPLFEFNCNTCNQSFEELLRRIESISEVTCPDCGGIEVKRKVSKIASRLSVTGAFSLGASAAASCSTGSA